MNIHVEGRVDPAGLRCARELIQQRVVRSVRYLGNSGSTNSLALADLRNGGDRDTDHSAGAGLKHPDSLPALYLSDVQSGGRGRMGRRWISDPANLAFSLVFEVTGDRPGDFGLLSIATGVAIARAIERELAPRAVQLKWPNDLWIQDRKCAGILIERVSSLPRVVVIGIGINVASTPSQDELNRDRPDRGDNRATCLADVSGQRVNKWAILAAVTRNVIAATNPPCWQAEAVSAFRQRCALTGRRVTFQLGDHSPSGICQGISDTGTLRISPDGGPSCSSIEICSGEATLIRL